MRLFLYGFLAGFGAAYAFAALTLAVLVKQAPEIDAAGFPIERSARRKEGSAVAVEETSLASNVFSSLDDKKTEVAVRDDEPIDFLREAKQSIDGALAAGTSFESAFFSYGPIGWTAERYLAEERRRSSAKDD